MGLSPVLTTVIGIQVSDVHLGTYLVTTCAGVFQIKRSCQGFDAISAGRKILFGVEYGDRTLSCFIGGKKPRIDFRVDPSTNDTQEIQKVTYPVPSDGSSLYQLLTVCE